MKTITLTDFLENKGFYLSEAKKNKIFIYPTDTIYGIGAIVSKDNEAKIFAIKHRDTKKMFSIIAPDFERIKEKYQLREAQYDSLQEYLEKYHGVTYIFDYTKPGVRIIKHPFQQFVEALKLPFITTSCNISGEPAILEIKNIPEEIASQVDYIIDGGILGGKPSVLIDFVNNKIIER